MPNTSITMRIDKQIKSQLQELLDELGMDMTTFFTMAAKQAVREQALPFHPDINAGPYGLKAYQFVMNNTKYDENGRATISRDDEWASETEWDELYEQLKKERTNEKG